jgi:hypothetical protein
MKQDIKQKVPKGLIVLGSLQIFIAVRGLWNLFMHSNPTGIPSLIYAVLAITCFVVGIGLIYLKRWAFIAFIAIYTIYILQYVSSLDYLSTAKCVIFVIWLLLYRRYFVSNSSAVIRRG